MSAQTMIRIAEAASFFEAGSIRIIIMGKRPSLKTALVNVLCQK